VTLPRRGSVRLAKCLSRRAESRWAREARPEGHRGFGRRSSHQRVRSVMPLSPRLPIMAQSPCRRWTRLGVRDLPLHRGCLDLGMAQRVGGGDGPGGKPLPGPRWIHRWHHGGSMRADRLPQTSHRRGSRAWLQGGAFGLAHGARGGSRPDRLPDSAGLMGSCSSRAPHPL